MIADLPAHKRSAIAAEFGESGKRWIAEYPTILAECLAHWGLQIKGVATAGLPINVILYVTNTSAESLVLKLGYPEQGTEAIALRAYQGQCSVKLIDYQESSGALLLQHLRPGSQLREVGMHLESAVLPLFVQLPIKMDRLDGIPDYGHWMDAAFTKYRARQVSDPQLLKLLEQAELLFRKLSLQSKTRYLLHGDLHHENILFDDKGGWLAIDPKGCIGPKIMECGRYLHNFMEDEIEGITRVEQANSAQLTAIFERRFSAFSKALNYSIADLTACTFIDLVLASCWSANSGQKIYMNRLETLVTMLS